jgi:MFS family permease
MKERVKWIVVGFGFMVGIQVLASLLFIGLAQMLKASPNLVLESYWVFVIFGLTLGAFFLGGFVIGRVEEAPRIIDAVIAAIVTLALSVIVFLALPESSHDQFTGSMWLADAAGNASSPWVGALLIAPALIASALGAYLGYSMTTQVESMVERFVAMSGLACAIGGPVIALIIGGFILPWYAVTVGLVIILSGFVISYWLLKRAAREADDVSISLDRGAETTR